MPTYDDLLVDTNAASAVIRAIPEAIAIIAEASFVHVPCIVAGELFYGAYHAPAPEPQIERVGLFISLNHVMLIDVETVRLYGRIRAELRAKGQLIPTNDTWIAAIALQAGFPLMTQDTHFAAVEGLRVVGW